MSTINAVREIGALEKGKRRVLSVLGLQGRLL